MRNELSLPEGGRLDLRPTSGSRYLPSVPASTSPRGASIGAWGIGHAAFRSALRKLNAAPGRTCGVWI
jgi:hypothetical protein